jgi:hypothetical protein
VLNAIAGWNEPITKAWRDNKCAVMAVSPFAMYRGEHKMDALGGMPTQETRSQPPAPGSTSLSWTHTCALAMYCFCAIWKHLLLDRYQEISRSFLTLCLISQVRRISSGLTSGKLPQSASATAFHGGCFKGPLAPWYISHPLWSWSGSPSTEGPRISSHLTLVVSFLPCPGFRAHLVVS